MVLLASLCCLSQGLGIISGLGIIIIRGLERRPRRGTAQPDGLSIVPASPPYLFAMASPRLARMAKALRSNASSSSTSLMLFAPSRWRPSSLQAYKFPLSPFGSLPFHGFSRLIHGYVQVAPTVPSSSSPSSASSSSSSSSRFSPSGGLGFGSSSSSSASSASSILAYARRHGSFPLSVILRAEKKRRLRVTTPHVDGDNNNERRRSNDDVEDEDRLAEVSTSKWGRRVRITARVEPGMRIWVPQSFVADHAPATSYANILNDPSADNSNSTAKHRKAVSAATKRLKERVLYQDDDFAVINKPAGMACQPGGRHGVNGRACVSEVLSTGRLFDENNANTTTSEVRPRLVHRLDAMTTGVLVVARSDEASNFFTHAFRAQTAASTEGNLLKEKHDDEHAAAVEKWYVALVRAKDNANGRLRNETPARRLLAQVDERAIKLRSSVPARSGSGSSTARADVRVIAATGCPSRECGCTIGLVQVKLDTGRKHQIRRQLAREVRWPVIGDHPELWRGADKAVRSADAEIGRCPRGKGCFFYGAGGEDAPTMPLWLHAERIAVHIPGSREPVVVRAPLPSHFNDAIEWLKFKRVRFP